MVVVLGHGLGGPVGLGDVIFEVEDDVEGHFHGVEFEVGDDGVSEDGDELGLFLLGKMLGFV